MQHGTATLEDNLVISYKIKHAITIGPNSATPLYLPKRAEAWLGEFQALLYYRVR